MRQQHTESSQAAAAAAAAGLCCRAASAGGRSLRLRRIWPRSLRPITRTVTVSPSLISSSTRRTCTHACSVGLSCQASAVKPSAVSSSVTELRYAAGRATHPVVGELRDVQQRIEATRQRHEGAKVHDLGHLGLVDVAVLRACARGYV